ncbi:TonB-dependent receptor [Sphingomonas quercus]|uniref:TonB-dependent receptor n=1 Tax=Sphingomonas quercus TaxID=2842451 RepID=A0ABS6BHX5_9SPHN|nr:TonB-dependent receptor [Sphingomonas quercus]MBU3077911.1 TonB-dependent receptor [Sphingomonas quercus]
MISSQDIVRRRGKYAASAACLALAFAIASPARAADGAAIAEDAPGDIVVTGQRLSTESALEAKRNSQNVVDIIAADDLGKLPDANVADALARIPGVSVIVNQDTGEGQYVTVRGLSGTYNAVMINGIRVAQTDTSSRDVSLNVLPPNGLAAIRVTKTLTPDQDGDAIGGTIDFRTPTAFDFRDRTTVRLYGSGGFNQQALDADEPAANYQAQADFATRLADDRFGFFVSGNYGVSHGNGQETENDGEWEPYKWRKDAEEPIDETNMHLPGIDLDYRRLKQTRYGGNFSFDYHGGGTQLYLRGQYARQKMVGTNDITDYRSRPTARLSQVNIDDTSLVQPENAIIGTGSKGRIYNYTTSQIVDADGDGMITDADRGTRGLWSLNGRSGVFDPQAMQFARSMSTLDQNQTLATIALGGHSDLNRLKLDYELSYSGGVNQTPESYSVGYNCDACTYPLNATGINWVSNDPRFPHAALPAFAQNVERDAALLPFDGASTRRSKQTDDRVAARLDARYDFDGVLDYVKVGGKYLRSKRHYDNTPIWDGDFSGTPLDGLNLADSGLVDKEVASILRGQYYYGDVYSRKAVVAAIKAAQVANPGDAASATDLVADDKRSTETIYAGYGLAHLTLDAVQMIGGLRVERRETHNEFWVDDGDNSRVGSTDRGYTVLLPSLTAIWRPAQNQAYHAAIWTGYSPPEYGYISAGQSVTRDASNEIIAISQGNPDLKAARAVNADVSAEYYPDATSIISLGAYYKRIRNFIFTNGSSVSADTLTGTIEISQPQNGKTATVYGIELNLIKSLQGLQSPFDGFGVEGNVTVQHSEADTGQPYRNGKKIRLINTPHLLYNASLTYQKYGIEAKLSYNYRGKYIESLRDNAVDKWVRPNRSLDFHSRYNFTKHFAMDFDVANILNAYKYYTTKGDNPSYQKDYMEPGRTFVMRASYIF